MSLWFLYEKVLQEFFHPYKLWSSVIGDWGKSWKMLGDGERSDNGMKEEEIMMILFGKEFGSLSRKGFDGSKEEHQMFVDIFYGGSFWVASNSCVSGALLSQRDGARGSCRKASNKINMDSSNISSNSSVRGSSRQAVEFAKNVNAKAASRSEYRLESKLNSQKSNSLSGSILDQAIKEPSCSYPCRVDELVESDSQDYHPFPHRIVESFAHCILSSYYSVNELGSVDAASSIHEYAILKNNSVQQIGENKIVLEANLVTSPVSQESTASELLKAGPSIQDKEMTVGSACMEQIALETILRHSTGGPSKRGTNREIPDLLESYAQRLLVDAGWRIEPRVRKERNRAAYFFRKPEAGLVLTSLSGAWKACGERLLYTASELEKDDNGREWSDVDEFWGDLKDVLAYISLEAQNQESKLSLVRRWQLLDPFLAVVFIHRKVSVLRMGKLVRAVRSATFVADFSEDIVSEAINMSETQKRKSKGLSNKCKFIENDSLALNAIDSPNNYGSDSPVISDLESGDPCECTIKMLSENELYQDTTNARQMSFLKRKGNQLCERNGLSLKEKFAHRCTLGNSAEVCSHVERSDAFSSKEVSSTEMLKGLPKTAHKKSKKMTEMEATKLSVRKRRSGSKGKHRKSSAYSLDDINSGLIHFPCHEAPDMSISECLEPSECLKRQTSNMFSTSEDECSHTSEMQEASFTIKIQRTLKLEKKTSRNKDKKKTPILSLEKERAITFASIDEVQDDELLFKSIKCEGIPKMMSSNNSTLRSLHMSQSKSKKIQHKCHNLKETFNKSHKSHIPRASYAQDSKGEVVSTTDALSPVYEKSQKISKGNELDDKKGGGKKRSRNFHINDDDLLIAAIIKKKDFGTSYKKSPTKPAVPQPEALKMLKNQNRCCRLLPRAPGSSGKLSIDGKQFVMGARTVLCWLIGMGAVSLKDILQFRNQKDHDVIKDGWVTRDGIFCKCCSQIFSVSDFKAHAGFRQQKLSLNLYLQSGKSYTLCQLQAWSAEYKARKGGLKSMNVQEVDQNDDTCGVCGDGGELICCDNCPSTYHQSCLSAQELPEECWYCSHCNCKICNNLVCMKEDLSSLAVFECTQCEHKYHGKCIKGKCARYGNAGSNTWFCGENCKEVFLGLRSRLGMLNFVGDGFSWTVLRCNHDDQNVYSPQKIALMAECNSKLAIALILMQECFVPMVDPRTGIDMIPHVLYSWGSNFPRLNYQGFYTVILEKCDTLISVASVRVHGVKVAEMPLIATCVQQRRQGMCRRLMNAIEMMLRSFKVEMMVLSAIPSLVETWISGFGFSALNAEDKKLLDDVNLMLFPGTVMLKKKLCEASFQETGGSSKLYSTQDGSQILMGFDKEKYGKSEQQSAKDSMELDVESMFLTSTNLEREAHSLKRDILMPSFGNVVPTAKDTELADSTLTACSNIDKSSSDSRDETSFPDMRSVSKE